MSSYWEVNEEREEVEKERMKEKRGERTTEMRRERFRKQEKRMEVEQKGMSDRYERRGGNGERWTSVPYSL